MNEKISQIIEWAIKQEKLFEELYHNLSFKVDDISVSEILGNISLMEKKHKQKLEIMKKKFFVDYSGNEYENIDLPKIDMNKISSEFGDVKSVLNFALKMEGNTKEFYLKMAKKTTNKEIKRIFEMLSKEEARHELVIDDLINKI